METREHTRAADRLSWTVGLVGCCGSPPPPSITKENRYHMQRAREDTRCKFKIRNTASTEHVSLSHHCEVGKLIRGTATRQIVVYLEVMAVNSSRGVKKEAGKLRNLVHHLIKGAVFEQATAVLNRSLLPPRGPPRNILELTPWRRFSWQARELG